MTMSTPVLTKTDILIENLTLRDVPYFARADVPVEIPSLSDSEILTELSTHEGARIQMALIPLLLRCPSFSDVVPDVVDTLSDSDGAVLKLYYTAAVLLQSIHENELRRFLGDISLLKDIYSKELEVEGDSAEERLHSLAASHARLSGLDINWVGTYRHSAERFLKALTRWHKRQNIPQ
jgi:hypothetical protein